jgi:flagellar biosynthesis protein FlhB
MAGYDQFAKTEQATPRRREKAREEGEVAISRELIAGVGLLVFALVMRVGGDSIAKDMLSQLHNHLSNINIPEIGIGHVSALGWLLLSEIFVIVGILLTLMCLGGVAATVAQVGFRITPLPLQPKWERLSPFDGWSRLFSMNSLVRTGFAALKAVVLLAIMIWVLRSHGKEIQRAGSMTVTYVVDLAWSVGMHLTWSISLALVVMGVVDYLFQRFQFEQRLMMTRQELKEEFRDQEGDPQVRAKIKRLQREMSKNKMLRSVPTATVVVTNPTHLAVAIFYENGKTVAPKVVAKGAGPMAKQIVTIAKRHNVPVVERKPVARALFKSVDVGQDVPPHLYQAIVEILTFLYRLGRFR